MEKFLKIAISIGSNGFIVKTIKNNKGENIKMKKIMILLEWGAYPIAQLDDNGFILDDIGAEELGFDETFCDEVQDLQDRYDNLFIDNGIEFRYIGDEKT